MGTPAPPRGSTFALWGTAGLPTAVAGFLAWRSSLGFDLRDGSYVIVLAQRVARGDVPLRDEASLHVLGSLPAVPFAWVWDEFMGSSGMILAHRLYFVVLLSLFSLVTWAALRPIFGAWPTTVGVSGAAFVLPYNLLVTSYSSMSTLAMTTATAAAFRVMVRPSRRWVACLCISCLIAVATFFVFALPAVVLVLGTIWSLKHNARESDEVALRYRRLLSIFLIGSSTFAAIAVLIWWPIVMPVVRALISQRLSGFGPLDYLSFHLKEFFDILTSSWTLVVAACLALLASLPLRLVLLKETALASLPWLVLLWSAHSGRPNSQEPTDGRYSGVVGLTLLLLLALPVLVRWWPHLDPLPRSAVLVTGVAGSVGFLTVASFTASMAAHGVPTGAASGLIVLQLAAVMRVLSHSRFTATLLLVGVLAAFSASWLNVVFNEGPASGLQIHHTEGPLAGLTTGDAISNDAYNFTAALSSCTDDRDGLLIFDQPGVGVLTTKPLLADRVWMLDRGESSVASVTRKGLVPGCVVASERLIHAAPSTVSEFFARYTIVDNVKISPSPWPDVPTSFVIMSRN